MSALSRQRAGEQRNVGMKAAGRAFWLILKSRAPSW